MNALLLPGVGRVFFVSRPAGSERNRLSCGRSEDATGCTGYEDELDAAALVGMRPSLSRLRKANIYQRFTTGNRAARAD
jgi:hypothetical protein